jgi:beta-glucosidase
MSEHESPIYLEPDRPIEERVRDLVARMTLEEKISQMVHPAAAIERLGVPEYNWWNECLHGVGRAGIATVFPQAIGLAATWNTDLMLEVATAISDEARAKHHQAVREDNRGIYYGLTFWSPNINIFRDPRWGRGQETYGEDPYLTARLGVAFVRGLQGDDPDYLKVVATPKHYAVHSGPEEGRHSFDARVSERDLHETYLPAFEATVCEAGAWSVMGAYNRTNGEACCASPTLLGQILREEWGFEGYVVSDCGAIKDIWAHHQLVETPEEAAALAVREGCDLNCGATYEHLLAAVEQGLIDEATIDVAVTRLFTARFKLGMFDPDERVPYAQIPYGVNDCAEHRALALEAARQSMVLLKNDDGFLPLSRDLKKVAVIGPNADDIDVLLGNYSGTPSSAVTPLQGVRNLLGPDAEVLYARGCGVTDGTEAELREAVAVARQAEVAIVCLGLSQEVEGEEGANKLADRTELALPGRQEQLLRELYLASVPTVLVLLNGSAVAINWADAALPAIVEAWYPGEEGGTALAEVLFGVYNPAGRLPVTFYRSEEQLPPFEDYAMAGHTYRFFEGEPLYPFGHGLSYTRFVYNGLTLTPREIQGGESVEARVIVRNLGDRAGDEVVQVYLKDVRSSFPVPLRTLVGFRRIHLEPGKDQTLTFAITADQMAARDRQGRPVVQPGEFIVSVGGGQPIEGGPLPYLTESFKVTGKPFRPDEPPREEEIPAQPEPAPAEGDGPPADDQASPADPPTQDED